ncbi:MAG TPA: LysM domain-containing protein [Tepidisphaeraceae bacterium]|jgi:5'-nucleotidase
MICAMALTGVGLMSLTGCSGTKKTYGVPQSESVTDVSAPAPAPAPMPAAPQPVAQPVVYDNMTTTPAASGSIGGGSYTVKRGDTLYSIARNKYGDGKQWTKIATANPGLRPETLKVGQTIVVP